MTFQPRVALVASLVAVTALVACSGKESVPVVGTSPTPVATGSAAPSATPTAVAATPTPTPVGATPTPKASATPTPVATATPTSAPGTPTPTPVPACAAPPPDPVTETITLTGAVQQLTLPCYADTTITATVPANNSSAASPIKVAIEGSEVNKLGAMPTAGKGTVIGYVSLSPSATVNFTPSTAAIASHFSSPSLVTAGHTYNFEVQVAEFGDAVIQSGPATLGGDTVSFGIAPPGGSFNGGLHAVVVLYKQ